MKSKSSSSAVRVAKSHIQGTGLFAQSIIKARSKVGEMTGEIISVREGRRRAKTAKRIVIVDISEKHAIDGSVGDCPFQYVNHSCAANLYIRVAYGRVELYAKRRIGIGKELTCDYGDSHHNGKLPCRCGARQCRKFI